MQSTTSLISRFESKTATFGKKKNIFNYHDGSVYLLLTSISLEKKKKILIHFKIFLWRVAKLVNL